MPFVIDSSDPSRPGSPEIGPFSGPGTPHDVWENGSDVMESLSSDISAPRDSSRGGGGNSQDSWNGDDEDSMSDDLGEWLQNDTQPHTSTRRAGPAKRRYVSSSTRSSRLAREAARMEPPPFVHNENFGLTPADEAEMLGDDEDGPVPPRGEGIEMFNAPANQHHYHSDNDLSIHMQVSVSQNSSAIAYSESDLIGPNARDFSFPSPTVFPARGAAIGISRRQRSISITPQSLPMEGNNENVPRRKSSGKRRTSSHRMAPPKPPITLPSKTRLTLRIKKWNLGATWKWNAGDENCGICRMPFEACCTDCRTPGDDCPLAVGVCKHSFHMHCIVKWTESQNNPRPQCPLCRQEWIFATE